jgi:hypothetical protein
VPKDHRPHDVQVRVLLAREGGRRQVLRRRAGSDGVGCLLTESSERAGDRRRQIVRHGDRFDAPSDLRARRADRPQVIRVQARQPIVERRHFRHDPIIIGFAMLTWSAVLTGWRLGFYGFAGRTGSVGHVVLAVGVSLLIVGAVLEGYYGGPLSHRR